MKARGTLIGVLISVSGLSGCGGDGENAEQPEPEPTPATAAAVEELEEAAAICGNRRYGNEFGPKDQLVKGSDVITMEGNALVLDGYGDQFVSVPAGACVLGSIDTPATTMSKVESTTSMMGRQTDTFGDYELTWSYHPDNGLDLIIEVVEE